MSNLPSKNVLVVGAGISGLSFAYYLKQNCEENKIPINLSILEKSSRIGGTIATESRDGFLLEKGPDSFLSEKPWALDLAASLCIQPEIIGTNEQNRRVFVERAGKLHGIPDGFHLIAPKNFPSFLTSSLFSWRGKMRVMMEMGIPKSCIGEDESVASFMRRRFGGEALERVGQPMIAGVYSGDPERLSMQNTMPRFKDLEAKHGSVILGLRKSPKKDKSLPQKTSGVRYSLFLSFKKGMETLTHALKARFSPDVFNLASEISSMSLDPASNKWIVRGRGGQLHLADLVCFTCSAKSFAGSAEAFSPVLAEKLRRISYESVATLHFAFPENAVSHPMNGFGFVVPAVENRSFMACTFAHRKFTGRAPAGHVLMRAFIGGAFGKKYFNMPDGELQKVVLGELSGLIGIKGQPLFSSLNRYPQALPQYEVGHLSLVRSIEEEAFRFPGIYFTGASYRGTGIPDCVFDAKKQAQAAFSYLKNEQE